MRETDSEGKGALGCVGFLALLGIFVLAAMQVGPAYYAKKSLETDVRTEISRAGANFHDDETLLKNILDLARRNEIRLTRENVKVERFAGQIFVTIQYSAPVDLYVTQRTLQFDIKASSFVGRL
jgi:hypothetical protein